MDVLLLLWYFSSGPKVQLCIDLAVLSMSGGNAGVHYEKRRFSGISRYVEMKGKD